MVEWGASRPEILSDYPNGLAIIRFKWKENNYEFRYKSKNASEALSKLSWSLCRIIDCDIRGILPFSKTGKDYLSLPAPEGFKQQNPVDSINSEWFAVLGCNSNFSNEEIKKQFHSLAGMYHPDRALSSDDKPFYEKKMSELNRAYSEIKKVSGFD